MCIVRRGKKVKTLERVFKNIKRGERIFIGSGASAPQAIIGCMINHAHLFSDSEICHIATFVDAPYVDVKYRPNFRHTAFYVSGNTRSAVNSGAADYTPIHLSDLPRLLKSDRMKIGVCFIQVARGRDPKKFSLGLNADVVRTAMQNSDCIVAQVNDQMPFTYGETLIHKDEIDYLIEDSVEIPKWEIDRTKGEVENAIGRQIASLVPNGATLQLGLGRLPDLMADYLLEKKDLGVHTEMFSNGLMKLVQAGVVNNRKKAFDIDACVTSMAWGTQELYDFLNENPEIRFMGTEYVNDPRRIGMHEKMVSIQTALEVDLSGQVSSDSADGKVYSGIGGQVDFFRGAALADVGRPILVLPSRSLDGKYSRIVFHLSEGAGVVTSRGDVHYVVTEYGTADLFGKTVQDRALSLIEIAHPDFRDELHNQAVKCGMIEEHQPYYRLNILKHKNWMESAIIKDGSSLLIRPIRPSDEKALQDFFYSHSMATVVSRYGFVKQTLSRDEALKRTTIDEKKNMVLVALDRGLAGRVIQGVARYTVCEDSSISAMAEVGIVLRDDLQGKGIGTRLLKKLVEVAKDQGIKVLEFSILNTNTGMIALFKRQFPQGSLSNEGDGTLTAIAEL